jgi:hypothetical protein
VFEYRLYFIEANGHIAQPAKVLHCRDDQSVVKEAAAFIDGRDVEIWQGGRVVAYIVSDRPYRRAALGPIAALACATPALSRRRL